MLAESQSTRLRRRDELPTAITPVLSVLSMSLWCSTKIGRHQYMSECPSVQNKIHQVVRFVKAQYLRHACKNRNREQKLLPTEAGITT